MENNKKLKKDYQSTKDYSKKYNKENINIQLNRELINTLKEKTSNQPLKKTIENLIDKFLQNLQTSKSFLI